VTLADAAWVPIVFVAFALVVFTVAAVLYVRRGRG
jgi:hypothetical protein